MTDALAPCKETLGIPNSSSCPADVLLPNWSCCCHVALDISVISPLQRLTISGAASTPGHTLQFKCTQWKLQAHFPFCRSVDIKFIPMVVEVLGGWSTEAISNIRKIGKALGLCSSSTCSTHGTRHLFGQLAIPLWKGNACAWLRHMPAVSPTINGSL